MKSMLHEAPSIQKAIEQAWTAAGNPSEFTIKVLDAGEKGLLWFVKRPAIISISYEPKKNPGKQKGTQGFGRKQKLPVTGLFAGQRTARSLPPLPLAAVT